MIRLVLDTNVLVSGIFWSGPPSAILDAWQETKVKLILSPDILQEYIRVMNLLSARYAGVDINQYIDLFIIHGELLLPKPLPTQISKDPNDDMFIAAALAAKSRLIVSGDKDLLDVNGYQNIDILKPNEFVVQYL